MPSRFGSDFEMKEEEASFGRAAMVLGGGGPMSPRMSLMANSIRLRRTARVSGIKFGFLR